MDVREVERHSLSVSTLLPSDHACFGLGLVEDRLLWTSERWNVTHSLSPLFSLQTIHALLLLLRSPAISPGFTFLGEIFAYVTVS